MRCFTALALGLTLAVACNAAESPGDVGGGTQRPQPEPELLRYVSLDPDLVRIERTAAGLVVRGEPGAVDANDEHVVVTELRAGAPVVEVEVAADSSFSASFASTGATQVQITPTFEDTVGASWIFAVDAAGAVTRVAPPCLLGTSGLWQMGNLTTGPRILDLETRVINQCDGPVTLRTLAPRIGTEFSVGRLELPRVMQPGDDVTISVRFALELGQTARGAPRYDVVDVEASGTDPAAAADSGRGFVVRVTRQPVTSP